MQQKDVGIFSMWGVQLEVNGWGVLRAWSLRHYAAKAVALFVASLP